MNSPQKEALSAPIPIKGANEAWSKCSSQLLHSCNRWKVFGLGKDLLAWGNLHLRIFLFQNHEKYCTYKCFPSYYYFWLKNKTKPISIVGLHPFRQDGWRVARPCPPSGSVLRERPLDSSPLLLLLHTYFLAWLPFHFWYTSFSENLFPVRPAVLACGSCFSCVSNFLPSDFYNPFLFLNLTFRHGFSSSHPPLCPLLIWTFFCGITMFLGLWKARGGPIFFSP